MSTLRLGRRRLVFYFVVLIGVVRGFLGYPGRLAGQQVMSSPPEAKTSTATGTTSPGAAQPQKLIGQNMGKLNGTPVPLCDGDGCDDCDDCDDCDSCTC